MFWIVLSIIAALAIFLFTGFKKDLGKTVWKVNKKQLLTLLALLLFLPSILVSVPTGHTGIVTTFGSVEDYTFEAGLHTKLPWQEVTAMDNRAQKSTIDMECFSSDIQEVRILYSINYQIQKENAQTIYKTIGVNYFDTVMSPRIAEAVKSVTAKYSAETLVESRENLSTQITDVLKTDLAQYNIIVIATAIENMDFTDAFTDAVEAKQVAEQNKLKAAIEQEQLTLEQQSKAERDVIDANAAAEVAKIQAEADKEVQKTQADAAEYKGQKEAAVNEALSGSLNEDLIRYYEIQQWDGKLPGYYVTSDGTVLPILGSPSGTDGGSTAENGENAG